MTRVLMVSSLWPPVALGGAERYAAQLAAALRSSGHDVGIVTAGVEDVDAVDGVDVVAGIVPWPYRLDTWASQPRWKRLVFHGADVYRASVGTVLGEAIVRFAPDVVHTHAVQGLSATALSTPGGFGRPHVHSLHDYWLLCQRTTLRSRRGRRCRRCSPCNLLATLRRAALARSSPDVYLAPSTAVARQHAVHARARDRIRVLHHPAPTVPTRSAAGRTRDPYTFGYLGQLTEAKGVRTLLAAIGRVAASGRDVRLLVAGDGPLREHVEAHGSVGVEALGWVDVDAREAFFDAISCLVVPSEWEEPAGLVVMEAAARGIPVIGADIGGIPEYVAPASRTLLFSPGDVNALARSMATAIARGERSVAVDTVHLMSWGEHIEQVLAAYDDAARHARSGR